MIIKVANKSDVPSQRADPWRDHADIHNKATRNRMQDPAFHPQAPSPCESIQDSGIQGFKRSEGRAKRDPELLVYIYICMYVCMYDPLLPLRTPLSPLLGFFAGIFVLSGSLG